MDRGTRTVDSAPVRVPNMVCGEFFDFVWKMEPNGYEVQLDFVHETAKISDTHIGSPTAFGMHK